MKVVKPRARERDGWSWRYCTVFSWLKFRISTTDTEVADHGEEGSPGHAQPSRAVGKEVKDNGNLDTQRRPALPCK